MTLDTEQRTDRMAPVAAIAKPPPHTMEEQGGSLFQSMDELRTRHADAEGTGQRIMQWAMALLTGLLLFAILYGVILFLE